MNERIRIKLIQDGSELAINSISKEGILLNNERDAWPRGLGVRFGPNDEITRYRMKRIATVEGWELGQFKLNLALESGSLLLAGVKHDTFPIGNYWIEFQIADLVIPGNRVNTTVKENEETKLEIQVKDDPRRVELSKPVSEFDNEIQRVLVDPGSRLDGLPAVEWLSSPNPRARRKACLLNILANLRVIPSPQQPLLASVVRVFFADVDRLYVKLQSSFFSLLDGLVKDPKKPVYDEGTPRASIHQKLLERIAAMEANVEGYTLRSFRSEGNPSLQTVVAAPPAGDVQKSWYGDVDIDLGNPLQDAAGLFIHLGELLASGKTDHFKLRATLAKQETLKPFLYYVIEG